jgi:hypothetical protein
MLSQPPERVMKFLILFSPVITMVCEDFTETVTTPFVAIGLLGYT